MTFAVALILAVLVGLSLGVLGGGGSILTVPVFVYGLGIDPKAAIAMSLPVVGGASLGGAIGHWRAGNVHVRPALVCGTAAMAGAYLGARAAVLVTGSMQLALLSVLMIAVSSSMLITARAEPVPSHVGRPRIWVLPLVGLVVGMLTGLLGIGGGFLVVPALVLFAGVPIRHAIGTSLVVIAMNAAAGLAGYLGRVDLQWDVVGLFTAMAMVGILAGTRLSRFASPAALRRGFAVFLLLIGGSMLYENRAAIFPGVRVTSDLRVTYE